MNVYVWLGREWIKRAKGRERELYWRFLSDNKQHTNQDRTRWELRAERRTWRGTIDEGISRGRAEKNAKQNRRETAGLWRSSFSSSFPFYISFSILLYGMIVVRLWSLCVYPLRGIEEEGRNQEQHHSVVKEEEEQDKKKTTKRGRE